MRSCLHNYKCSSYGEFRTLLERFNVSIEECTGNVDGRSQNNIRNSDGENRKGAGKDLSYNHISKAAVADR